MTAARSATSTSRSSRANKFLTTSSVPLLWNDDIADPAKRADANFLKATSISTGLSRDRRRAGLR